MSGPQNDFAGRNGQVWFVGVIEDRNDPAKIGRVRVRIIGWHDENTNITPTESLPWAQVSAPANGSRHSSLPREGDWVHGFFFDGHAGQQPFVVGVIPGIISRTPRTPTGANDVLAELEAQLVTEQSKLDGMLAGQSDATLKQKRDAQQRVVDQKQAAYDAANEKQQRIAKTVNQTLLYVQYKEASDAANAALIELNTAKADLAKYTTVSVTEIQKQRQKVESLKKEIDTLKTALARKPQTGFQDTRTNAQVETGPRPFPGIVTDRKDESSLPLHAVGDIARTGIDMMNKNRSHVCDTALYIRAQMAAARIATGQIAQAIREGIKLAMEALGISPVLTAIAEKLKSLTKLLKRITTFLNEINDYVTVFTTYIAQIKAVIEYIQSLPEQIAYLFKKCLTEAYAELAKGMRLMAGDFTVGTPLEIIQATSESMQAWNEAAVAAQKVYEAPNRIMAAIKNPSGMTLEEREKVILSLFPDNEKHDESQFAGALL